MPHALLADVPPLCMQHVLGGCELILPHLAALVGRNSELVEQAAALEYREAVSMIGCTPAKRKKIGGTCPTCNASFSAGYFCFKCEKRLL